MANGGTIRARVSLLLLHCMCAARPLVPMDPSAAWGLWPGVIALALFWLIVFWGFRARPRPDQPVKTLDGPSRPRTVKLFGCSLATTDESMGEVVVKPFDSSPSTFDVDHHPHISMVPAAAESVGQRSEKPRSGGSVKRARSTRAAYR